MRSFALVALVAGTASADPMAITGTVTDAQARWTPDGSRIITESTVRTANGDVVVSQLGGTIDGLTMMTFPGPPILKVGMIADLVAHVDYDLQQRAYNVIDDVRVQLDPTEPPGFVRTGPTKAGHYLFWESGCVYVTADSAGTTAIAGDGEFTVIDASIATWNTDTHTSTCSYLQVIEDPKKAVEVGGKDNVNVIKFRDTTWGRPAVDGDPARPYNASAAGITTATFVDDSTSSRDGAIVDADIEINGVNFAISVNDQTTSTQPCHAELQNTLTHELGHLHGLEHTCLAPGDPPRVDDQGNAVPQCGLTTDPKILDATMYNFQDCGETKKETLSPDDINAICTIYPVAKDPKTCSRVSSPAGCCSVGGDGREAALLAALVGFLAFRRRPRILA